MTLLITRALDMQNNIRLATQLTCMRYVSPTTSGFTEEQRKKGQLLRISWYHINYKLRYMLPYLRDSIPSQSYFNPSTSGEIIDELSSSCNCTTSYGIHYDLVPFVVSGRRYECPSQCTTNHCILLQLAY